MSQITEIIALVFDFDDTLVPDSTTKLLKTHGIDTDKFWKVQAKELIQQGYDPPTAYLKLIFDNIGEGKPLGNLTNAALTKFGETIDGDFYDGLPEFFDEVKQDVDQFGNIEVEFYIISGGLQAVLEGSKIVNRYFKGFYGCQLAGDTDDGVLKYIKRCITFTEKTRYLFEINKGIPQTVSRTSPHKVNSFVEESKRRVPLSNMIYVGDGLTDIPCFSLLNKNKGTSFGVFDPASPGKAKLALSNFLEPNRVSSMHAPKYSRASELGSLLHAAVAVKCLDIQLKSASALR